MIPETVMFIGEKAFAKCNQMKSLTIYSDDVIHISESCFDEQTIAQLNIYVPKKNIKSYKKILPSAKKIKAI